MKLNPLKLNSIKIGKPPSCLATSTLKRLLLHVGLNLNTGVLALSGVNSASSINNLLFSLKKRSTSIKVLILLKHKYYRSLVKLIRQHWQLLINERFYKGLRYSKSLPVRGQRTHTNASTARKLNGRA
jgi:ribosomal protein S13